MTNAIIKLTKIQPSDYTVNGQPLRIIKKSGSWFLLEENGQGMYTTIVKTKTKKSAVAWAEINVLRKAQ